MRRRSSFPGIARLVVLTGLLVMLAAAGNVRLEYFRVEETDNTLVVQWRSLEENALRAYEVHRRTRSSDGHFVRITSVTPQGGNRTYEFRDTQVFKSAAEDVTYRLEGVLASGERLHLGEQSVSYSPTAVRRIWGSIKAMFQ
jgi:hypothetical protein